MICRICDTKYKTVVPHLRVHNISVSEYKKLYPGVRVVSIRLVEERMLTRKEGYKTGKLKAWNDGLTKETDERVAYGGRRASEVKQEKKRQGAVYIPWSKGQTKETHPILAIISEKNKHQIPWSKGQTKETEPRLVLAAEVRSKTMLDRFRSGRIKIWNKGKTKETDHRVLRHGLSIAEGLRRFWERCEKLGIEAVGVESPNGEEKILSKYVSVFGYVYNRKVLCSGYSKILGRVRSIVPDFVSDLFPEYPIEYDGFLGHNPRSPYNKGTDIVAWDNERDQIYLRNGWFNIKIYPEDLQKGRKHIIRVMEERLCQNTNM